MSAAAENVGDTITVGDLLYRVTGASTVEVADEAKGTTATSYDIPETVTGTDGNAYTVTAIGEEAFKWSSATSVTLPSTITEVKKSAFTSSSLASITLPDGLKIIGPYAFSSAKLKTIDIPASVERIESHAFFGSSWGEDLTSITLHDGLKYIGEGAFYSQDFTEITIPATVDTIAKTAFLQCKKMTKVTLNEGLKYLGDGAFNSCSTLADITLPSTLEAVGIEVFMNDKALTKINIPANLTTIGDCFIAGTNVSTIELDSNNKAFVMADGVLYTKGYEVLTLAPVTGITDYTVKSSCKGIAGGAFWGSSVESVKLPDGVVAIGYGAFEGSQLKSINWPKNLVFIDTEAFANTQFTEVTLPDNINYVNDAEFSGCKNLTKVTIPSGVKEIYQHAFTNCSNLSTVIVEGTTAPVIMDYYEDYEAPFYNLASSATLSVPMGTKDSYSKAGYDAWFTIKEAATPTTLTVVSTTPADSSYFDSKYANMSFDVTFDVPVEAVVSSPAIRIQEGDGGSNSSLYSFSATFIEPSDAWYATNNSSDKKTMTFWGSDYDSYTEYFTAKDVPYYITIPSKVVKSVVGDRYNEQITIFVYGSQVASGVNNLSRPATATVVARYNLNGQAINGAQKGLQIVKLSDGTTRKIIVK